MSRTMRRRALDDYGRANLRLRSEPMPEAGPGEVLVKVAGVSLNHRDVMAIANGMGWSIRMESNRSTSTGDLLGLGGTGPQVGAAEVNGGAARRSR